MLSLEPGGLENGVVNVVNRLDPGQFRSSICCLKTIGAFGARITAPNVAIEAMGWRGGNDPWLVLRMATLFRRARAQIVHTRNAESFFYGFLAARLAGVRTIIHSEHGRTFSDRPLRFTVQRILAKRTDALFAVSAQLRDDLERFVGIPRGRISVLYNGVDLQSFAKPVRSAARGLLGVSEGDFVVGSVGRLVAVKNYALLLRAVAAAALPRLRVVLIGDGPEHAALVALAASLGLGDRAIFTGHREDVTQILPGLDAFVLPSISEGLSNTLLEAMAARVPVIASRVGGNAEIISNPSEGLLFESGDGDALRRLIIELANTPELGVSLAREGRARVEAQFSMEAMIGAYQRLYIDATRARR